MSIQGIRTKYGAKQSLAEIVAQFQFDGEVILTYDHPSWHRDLSGCQTEDESDLKMEEYFINPDIRDYKKDGKYLFTIWENGSFKKYVRNLAFYQSFLVWASNKILDETEYQFEKKNWKASIFGYESQLFYEVFTTQSRFEVFKGSEFIEYPGSINGPGGLGMET